MVGSEPQLRYEDGRELLYGPSDMQHIAYIYL